MIKYSILIFIAQVGLGANAMAEVGPVAARLVIFADVKAGDLKTDMAIKTGTDESLDVVSSITAKPGVHACFRGTSESLKVIVGELIANANKARESRDALQLKSFLATGQHDSVQIETTSEQGKSSMMKVDPC